MIEHTTQETLMYLRQCLLPGNTQDGIDLEIPSWLVHEAAVALAALEQRVERALKEIERYKLMSAEGGTTYNILDAVDVALAAEIESDIHVVANEGPE